MSYTHLQVRSGFSLMNSTITIDKLVAKAKEMNFQALALTDEGVLYGAISFYQLCLKNNIQPIIGLILPIRINEQDKPVKLTLLAKDNQGYKNLIAFSTKLQVNKKEALSLDELEEGKGSLIGILPVKNELLVNFLHGRQFDQAGGYVSSIQSSFESDDFYLGVEGKEYVLSDLKDFLNLQDFQLTALSDVHYLEERDVYSYDCLLAMKDGNEWDMQLSNPALEGKHLRTEEEVHLALGDLFPDAIKETERIARKCQVELNFNQQLLPTYPLENGEEAAAYLKQVCYEQAKKRYPELNTEIKDRLDYELEVIENMDFSDYFLIIADIIAFAKAEGIAVGPGRGSSAGSLVAYVLGITDVDPIQYNLLFERFLNPERTTMPDIDIDFSDERRDEVIHYVREKYGESHVAQIITFGTFAARSLIRELIKTLDVNPQDARFILRELPKQSSEPIAEMMRNLPELSEYVKQSPKLKTLFAIALRLEGLPRHISTHAAGVVMSEEPLLEHVPLTKGTGNTYLTQYAMNELEALGLLKMDFLGLRNLSLLEKVLQSIHFEKKEKIELDSIPDKDEKTFQLLREGRTNGVFQLESEGMKRVLRELQPTSFEDIVAVNALYRPGPMDFIPTYIKRKNGEEAVIYPHDDLKPILSNTYGVLVYQEQIMQIAKQIAGYSLGQADILRRAVSKKDQHVMQEEQQHFIAGCLKKGYREDVAEEIFSWIVRFSNYGFPRSHAVAYSKIAYQLAYLKAHYPENFFAELLSRTRQQEKLQLYMKELNEIGLTVHPPSINRSYGKYSVEEGNIRMGFGSISGIGGDAIKAILEARKNRPFKDLFDFFLQIDSSNVRRTTVENLILTGAFDELYENRASLLASIDQAMEQGELFREFRDTPSLFESQFDMESRYVEIEDFTLAKKLQDEKELVGMYLSSHPLENYRKELRANGFLSIADLSKVIGRKNMKTVSIIQEIKQIRTKRGEQMAFLVIADEQDTFDVVVFPSTYRDVKRWLEEEQLVHLTGKVEERNKKLQLVAERLEPFKEEMLEHRAEWITFIKSTEKTNEQALDVIATTATSYPGNSPVILYHAEENQSYKLHEDYYLQPQGAAIRQLRSFFGKENVVIQKR